jgi:hypothetical protein
MTSQRWKTVVSGVVLTLALAAGSPARAQFGFQGMAGSPSVSSFGLGYGTQTVYGASPFGYGSFGGSGYTALGGVGTFPTLPGYRLSSGQRPQTITSYQSISSAIILVPGWNGSAHRLRRRH